MTPLDLFFEDHRKPPHQAGELWTSPEDPARTGRKYGTLYHLRRNIDHCFGEVGDSEVPAPWPGALCIMSGIDLLSILYAGKDYSDVKPADCAEGDVWKYKNGSRFKQFIRSFFPESDQTYATTLYLLRNALVHSFSVQGSRAKFRLTADPAETRLVVEIPPAGSKKYSVDLCRLKQAFEYSVEKYRGSITTEDASFVSKFDDFGWMVVSPSPVEPQPAKKEIVWQLPFNHSLGISLTNQSFSTMCRAASGL